MTKVNEKEFLMKKKCRTCFTNTKGTQLLSKIASEVESAEERTTYGKILEEVTRIPNSTDSTAAFPQHICALCINKLVSAYDFVKQARDFEQLWHILYSNIRKTPTSEYRVQSEMDTFQIKIVNNNECHTMDNDVVHNDKSNNETVGIDDCDEDDDTEALQVCDIKPEIDIDEPCINNENNDESYMPQCRNPFAMHATQTLSSKKNVTLMDISTQLDRLNQDVQDIKYYILQDKQYDDEDSKSRKDIFEKLSSQNNILVNMVAEQTTALKSTLNPILQTAKYTSMFPMRTDEDLKNWDDNINEENKPEMIMTVKSVLGPKGIKNALTLIISQKLLLEYNLEGIHSKKRLKDYTKIMDVLFSASIKDNEPQTFNEDIRTALRNAKNRHFKEVCLKKKKEKEEEETNKSFKKDL